MESLGFEEKDFVACCGSSKFAREMAALSPFSDLDQALSSARDIWFNKVDVSGWLEAFAAHPEIGRSKSPSDSGDISAQWSKGEQSSAVAAATSSTLQELTEWNARYKQKFGFVFLICASGRSSPEILHELKKRHSNRPIVEFEIAAEEQMKITVLRIAKLFAEKANSTSISRQQSTTAAITAKAGDRVSIIGAHLAAGTEPPVEKTPPVSTRTRPPITTHVLDVTRGRPGGGIEVHLEMWKGPDPRPSFLEANPCHWFIVGSSRTDEDGRSGQLMSIVDAVSPGYYRISFDTGKYNPTGFFPYVSIVFEIRESQKLEHFHVPLLLSPFSFSTYRGS